jgi:hypothetical protein
MSLRRVAYHWHSLLTIFNRFSHWHEMASHWQSVQCFLYTPCEEDINTLFNMVLTFSKSILLLFAASLRNPSKRVKDIFLESGHIQFSCMQSRLTFRSSLRVSQIYILALSLSIRRDQVPPEVEKGTYMPGRRNVSHLALELRE